MKPCLLSIIGGVLAVVAGALGLAGVIAAPLAFGLGSFGGVLVVVASFMPGRTPAAAPVAEIASLLEPAKVKPVLPPAPVKVAREEEALMLLTLLQEKGRFLDFMMDDIAAYSDSQVGAAARVIHQGCKAVVVEAFKPAPVADVPENGPITLPQAVSREQYKFIGSVPGGAEIQGRLLHKGWRPTQVKLPKRTRVLAADELPVITPAEVQL